MFRSMSLRTVAGFPKPQQFQLSTTKEEEEGGWENPQTSHWGEMMYLESQILCEWLLGQYVLERYEGSRA